MCCLFHTPRKKWLTKVAWDKKLHTHLGIIDVSSTIGMEYGSAVRTTEGKLIFLMEPTIHDFIMKSERKTQIVYPKDLRIHCITYWAQKRLKGTGGWDWQWSTCNFHGKHRQARGPHLQF